jgi:hypothetical protein
MKDDSPRSQFPLAIGAALLLPLASPASALHRPPPATVTASGQTSNLTAAASAKASPVEKTTTNTVTNADGSITTTTVTVTRYPVNKIHGIVVRGLATGFSSGAFNYRLKLKNLSSSPDMALDPSSQISVTLQPSPPASNQLSVIATQFGEVALATLRLVLKPPGPSRITSKVTTPPPVTPPPVKLTPALDIISVVAVAPTSSSAERGPDASAPVDIAGLIERATFVAEDAIDHCKTDDPHEIVCVADALSIYADTLERLGPSLPASLRNLPAIVRGAERKVRAAKTVKEAVHAVNAAIAQIHKTISLLRADDRLTLDVNTREANFVVETLQVADVQLLKAGGL